MNDKTKFLIIGLVAGGILTTVFLSSATRANKRIDIVTENSMVRTIDRHFIEQMIPHHEDAITMSKLAKEKAQKEEIKKLADNIITSQTNEINQMKKWYKEWFGVDVPEIDSGINRNGMMGGRGMRIGMMGDTTDITSLENSLNFDREFLEQMIPHHQMAVMMAQMLKNSTKRSEMEQLADNIIKAQTEEIVQMRTWYRELGN